MFGRPILTGKRGSLIVDAAICLPFFVIAIAMLLMLIAQTGREESVTRAMVKSAIASVDAAAALEQGEDFFVTGNLSFRAAFAAAGMSDPGAAAGAGFPRMYTGIDGFPVSLKVRADDLAVVRVPIKTKLPSIGDLVRSSDACRTVVFRPFTGESNRTLQENDRRVYVFPKYGERYHGEGCYILKDGCVETILTKALKKRCSPCKVCRPDERSIGSKVYMYLESSSTYHKKECASITKSYISMPKSQALEEGYTPCGICGGGD